MKEKKIEINTLLALCELQNDYKIFSSEFQSLIKGKNIIYKLYNYIKSKKHIIKNITFAKFIEKYKHVLDVCNTYGCLADLTICSYDNNGNKFESVCDEYFINYIINNNGKVEIIKSNLEKLKKLGFVKIYFNEDYDFQKGNYTVSFNNCEMFYFLENIKIVPTYDSINVTYLTENSHFKMPLNKNKDNQVFAGDIVYLNDLTFDPSILPNEISFSTTLGILKKKYFDLQEEYEKIYNIVLLNSLSNDLILKYKELKKLLENLNDKTSQKSLDNLSNDLKSLGNDVQKVIEDIKNNNINVKDNKEEASLNRGV